MQLAPNNNPIEATVTQVSNNGETLTIVILKLPDSNPLPAFLQVGKIVNAKNLTISAGIVKVGDIISANIEVMGDPFTQAYLLHDVSRKETSETENE